MVTGTCYVVARPLKAALPIRREEREMACGRSKAETIRRHRDRLKGQPQERSLIAGAGSSSGFSTTARLARSFPIAFSGHTGPPIDQKQVVVVPFLVQETGHLATGHSG